MILTSNKLTMSPQSDINFFVYEKNKAAPAIPHHIHLHFSGFCMYLNRQFYNVPKRIYVANTLFCNSNFLVLYKKNSELFHDSFSLTRYHPLDLFLYTKNIDAFECITDSFRRINYSCMPVFPRPNQQFSVRRKFFIASAENGCNQHSRTISKGDLYIDQCTCRVITIKALYIHRANKHVR